MINVNSKSFNLEATDGKYDYNVYFIPSDEDLAKYNHGFLFYYDINQLHIQFENSEENIETLSFYEYLSLNEYEVRVKANEDKEYLNYLKSHGTDVDGLILYINHAKDVSVNLVRISVFFAFFLVCFCVVLIFKCKKEFYFISGIIYVIAVSSMFSNGTTDFLVVDFLNKINEFMNSTKITYQSVNENRVIFLDTMKESALAYIIFDPIFEGIDCFSKKYRLKKSINDYSKNMFVIVSFLQVYKSEYNNKIILRLNNKHSIIIKKCEKEILKLEKNKDKKNNNIYYQLYKDIKDDLLFLTTNTNEIFVDEFIQKMYYLKYKLDKLYSKL